jgi:hypothetical protein
MGTALTQPRGHLKIEVQGLPVADNEHYPAALAEVVSNDGCNVYRSFPGLLSKMHRKGEDVLVSMFTESASREDEFAVVPTRHWAIAQPRAHHQAVSVKSNKDRKVRVRAYTPKK